MHAQIILETAALYAEETYTLPSKTEAERHTSEHSLIQRAYVLAEKDKASADGRVQIIMDKGKGDGPETVWFMGWGDGEFSIDLEHDKIGLYAGNGPAPVIYPDPENLVVTRGSGSFPAPRDPITAEIYRAALVR